MAHDETIAARLRAALGPEPVEERRMFGGLCFMVAGNMVCGTYRDRAMYRVGKAQLAEALALPGVRQMAMAGRPMSGFAEVDGASIARSGERLMRLALGFVRSLPPKQAQELAVRPMTARRPSP